MAGYEVIGIEEKKAVNDIFDLGGGVLFRHGFEAIRGQSYQVRDFEKEFASYMNVKNALAVSSGTAALRVALASLNIGAGDEVLAPSFTFVATIEAIIESGAKPICTEIDETLNMDPEDLRKRITPRTKAVIVVHMLGTPAKMAEIVQICNEYKISLIEDTAWGCGGEFNGVKLGTIGDIGCFSFDFAKTITTGEGGMVVFNSEENHQKARAYHDHGHENNPSLPRWEDSRSSSGFNFRMSEVQGAIGRVQLSKLNYIIKKQRDNENRIETVISKYPEFRMRVSPENSTGTADAVVFHASPLLNVSEIRKSLLSVNISTKILPEATSWHFARHWTHLFDYDEITGMAIQESFNNSFKLLSSSISIPNGVYLRENFLIDLDTALSMATKKI